MLLEWIGHTLAATCILKALSLRYAYAMFMQLALQGHTLYVILHTPYCIQYILYSAQFECILCNALQGDFEDE